MTTAIGRFDHIRPQFRGKVAADFLAHLAPDGKWDELAFDPANDYQRHLYALFLRLLGKPLAEVWAAVYALSEDVLEVKRQKYADMVVHSEIVGFPRAQEELYKIQGIASK